MQAPRPQASVITDPDDISSIWCFLKKLNPNINKFFQRPKTKYSKLDPTWYDDLPIGKIQMGNMMRDISNPAGCPRTYANHCLRPTTVTTFHASRVLDRAVTCHRNSASLASYQNLSFQQRADMSAKLHDLPPTLSLVPFKQPQQQPQQLLVQEPVDLAIIPTSTPFAIEPSSELDDLLAGLHEESLVRLERPQTQPAPVYTFNFK